MVTENLERAFADTRGILANVRREQFESPTPCVSWDVRALLEHVIGGPFFFAACINDGKAPQRDDSGVTDGDFVATYDRGIRLAVAGFAVPGAVETTLEMPFGAVPAELMLGIFTTDVFAHGWDLACATGQPTDIDPELAGQLLEGARLFLQPGFRGPDTTRPFGVEQTAPPGATKADELAAFLGRRVS